MVSNKYIVKNILLYEVYDSKVEQPLEQLIR